MGLNFFSGGWFKAGLLFWTFLAHKYFWWYTSDQFGCIRAQMYIKSIDRRQFWSYMFVVSYQYIMQQRMILESYLRLESWIYVEPSSASTPRRICSAVGFTKINYLLVSWLISPPCFNFSISIDISLGVVQLQMHEHVCQMLPLPGFILEVIYCLPLKWQAFLVFLLFFLCNILYTIPSFYLNWVSDFQTIHFTWVSRLLDVDSHVILV